ncbi:sensor histidine kinase [Algibacillus agarilyticus]|uniref:sensor histidine kinase n=1 Tax=Algibacillus agarilyticus TaxID=2234133 RepID=UPI000DCFD779|nr:HAMP domain-containing sensor histidine kinase [Algibacillus agarilyticus]
MQITRYLKSLRVRIVLAFTTLACVSAMGYSAFAWFIYDVTDDRLFNWYALEITKHAVKTQQIPANTVNSVSFVGNEQHLLKYLQQHYQIALADELSTAKQTLAQLSNLSHITEYPEGYKVIDIEGSSQEPALQVVAVPWQNQTLYSIYDVSGFAQASDPSSLNADKFVLIILIPLAILVTLLAILLSLFLTRSVLKPLTQLAAQVENVQPEHLPRQFTGSFFPDEVGTLAQTLSTLLTRIDDYVESEKRFTREVSHELRTPTTSLTMALDLLQNTELDANQRKLIGRMQRANTEMTQLINTFLQLAKNTATGHTHEAINEAINVAAQTDLVIDKLSYLFSYKPIKIMNNVPAHITCHTNQALFEIVLSNLLRNAFQYTHQGHVCIECNNKALTISDTGFGIPQNELSNINQAFYSLQPDGVGLGMSIVQRITWQLGWQLTVASQSGEGTQVTLVFN